MSSRLALKCFRHLLTVWFQTKPLHQYILVLFSESRDVEIQPFEIKAQEMKHLYAFRDAHGTVVSSGSGPKRARWVASRRGVALSSAASLLPRVECEAAFQKSMYQWQNHIQMVNNLLANARDTASIPGLGTKIPHATGQLSLPATTLSLSPGSTCSTTREATTVRSPRTPTRKKESPGSSKDPGQP